MKKHVVQRYTPQIHAIDLFCGAGGLTHGLIKAGIKVRLGVDIDPLCEYPYTINNNASFLLKSITDIDHSDLSHFFRKNGIKLLAGCAPCQTFSRYNRKADETDKRWWLLLEFSRLINELSPELVTMENVPQLVTQNVFHTFLANLQKKGYFIFYEVIKCADYGLPQNRSRLVLLASKYGPITILTPKEFHVKPQTVFEAIGRLPFLAAGSEDNHDPLHRSSSLSALNMKRIKASSPGRTWKDWPKDLVADCHVRKTGESFPSVYGRMSWDEPAPTITTQFYGYGNGRFGHPVQDRALSLREGAILQSFPKNYRFLPEGDKICQKHMGRLIGNAVPVQIGLLIGKSFQRHISQRM